MVDQIRKKQEELQQIRDSRARWWKRLSRAVTAIEKLDAREKRLLKPRKLAPGESSENVTSKDLHQIHDPEFFDDSEVLATL